MEENLLTIIRLVIYLIAFLLFVVIFKFGLKKQLNYIRVAIAGIIAGIIIALIMLVITQGGNDALRAFGLSGMMGAVTAEAIICAIAFLILYLFSKSIYDWIKRKRRKEIEQK